MRRAPLYIASAALACVLSSMPAAAQNCPNWSPNFDRVSTAGGRQMVADIRAKNLDADIAASGGVQTAMSVNASTLAETRGALAAHQEALTRAEPLGGEAVKAAFEQVALDRDLILILEGLQDLFACRARAVGSSQRERPGLDGVRATMKQATAESSAAAEDRLIRDRGRLVEDARRTWAAPKQYGGGNASSMLELEDPFSAKGCAAAAAYRDERLYRAWESTMARYRVSTETAALLAQTKRQLLDSTWWARSRGPVVALAMKQLADTISGVLTAASPRASVLLLSRLSGERASLSTRRLYAAVESAVQAQGALDDVVEGAFDDLLVDIALQEVPRLLAVLDLVRDTAENIRAAEEYLRFQSMVAEQVERLDREFNRAVAAVQHQAVRLDAIETVKSAIDAACANKNDAS